MDEAHLSMLPPGLLIHETAIWDPTIDSTTYIGTIAKSRPEHGLANRIWSRPSELTIAIPNDIQESPHSRPPKPQKSQKGLPGPPRLKCQKSVEKVPEH